MPNCGTCRLQEDPRGFFQMRSLLMGVKRKMAQMPEASLQLHVSLLPAHACRGSRALRDEHLTQPACWESWSLEGVKKEPGEHRAAKTQADNLRRGKSIYNRKHAGRASISRAGRLKSDGFTRHQTPRRRKTHHSRTWLQSNMPVSV